MNIEKKLGNFTSGFTFPLAYNELFLLKRPLLTEKGWQLYRLLLTKAMRKEFPIVTLPVADAKRHGLADKTLARCRQELQGQGLIEVTRESPAKPYRYEILHPTNGGKLPRSEQRKKIMAAIRKDNPPRSYSREEFTKVITFLIGNQRLGDTGSRMTKDEFIPLGDDDSWRFLCPFHDNERRPRKYPLVIFPESQYWACAQETCRHHFDRSGRVRGGKGGLIHFVCEYKFRLDRDRSKKARNLSALQAREIINQILNGVSCVADVTYTNQNVETQELIKTPFDEFAERPVPPPTAPTKFPFTIRRTIRPATAEAADKPGSVQHSTPETVTTAHHEQPEAAEP